MMKLLFLAASLLSQTVLAGDSMSEFQWKNRLLIIPESTQALKIQIAREAAGIEERDLRVFVLNGPGAAQHSAGKELAAEFAKRLSLDTEEPKVFLIGKDGRTTLSWKSAEFSFKKLFASIDAMPMRQREMREAR